MMVRRVLEWDLMGHLQVSAFERADARRGHRSGYEPRSFKARVGALELRVPQVREGTFKMGVLGWD